MELRLLTTEADRRTFARRLSEVRSMRGAGFSETHRSVIGEVHLAFGNLYGLFDERSANPEMLGGFAMHDLAMFGQSYPKPDLTHLPPQSVFECGELWAVAAGAGGVLRHAGALLALTLEAKAVLVYPILKPWNLTIGYRGFTRIGEPIEWPYARTLNGGRIYVQAMVGEADVLARWVGEVGAYPYEMLNDGRRLRFDTPFAICNKQIIGRPRETPSPEAPAVAAANRAAA
jgi:hypothetical protein